MCDVTASAAYNRVSALYGLYVRGVDCLDLSRFGSNVLHMHAFVLQSQENSLERHVRRGSACKWGRE